MCWSHLKVFVHDARHHDALRLPGSSSSIRSRPRWTVQRKRRIYSSRAEKRQGASYRGMGQGEEVKKKQHTVKTTNSLSLFLPTPVMILLDSFSLSFSFSFSDGLNPYSHLITTFPPLCCCFKHTSRCDVSASCRIFGLRGATGIGSRSLDVRRLRTVSSTAEWWRIVSPGARTEFLQDRQSRARRGRRYKHRSPIRLNRRHLHNRGPGP